MTSYAPTARRAGPWPSGRFEAAPRGLRHGVALLVVLLGAGPALAQNWIGQRPVVARRKVDWPLASDFSDALQNPRSAFRVPALQQGAPTRNPYGLPIAISGAFASVYKVKCGQRAYAVRCFLSPDAERQQRYQQISAHLAAARLPELVSFEYVREGVRVRNGWYPIVQMDWVTARTLDRHVGERVERADSAGLERLAEEFRSLMRRLRDARIAHGDLQHGNILVEGQNLRLVDFDGMFIPAFQGRRATELGHPHYQHPGRGGEHFDLDLDNFSSIAIYLSLKALAADRGLWRFNTEENLIFTRDDFANPGRSPVFAALAQSACLPVRALAARLAELCRGPLAQVPTLEQALGGFAAVGPAAPLGAWWKGQGAQAAPAPVAPVQAGPVDADWWRQGNGHGPKRP
ncbi:MAG: hypothetical protein IT371_20885 [Deltaproteobacteria bacterium]|nr:hypothetical protein [Deltaproteobacteria bacterium]